MGSSSPANPASLSNVFVYGSLLADDVVSVLLRRVPLSSPAILTNRQRFSIKGRVYPAMIPVEDKEVNGQVLLGITPRELHILDEFEDVEYEREKVEVLLKDSSVKLEAYTYIWADKTDPDLHGEWDFEAKIFCYVILSLLGANKFILGIGKNCTWRSFLKMTNEFVEEFERPDSKSRVATCDSFYSGTNDVPFDA